MFRKFNEVGKIIEISIGYRMRRFEAIASDKKLKSFLDTFLDFLTFQIFQKCSRIQKWLKTCQGVQFVQLFHIKNRD